MPRDVEISPYNDKSKVSNSKRTGNNNVQERGIYT